MNRKESWLRIGSFTAVLLIAGLPVAAWTSGHALAGSGNGFAALTVQTVGSATRLSLDDGQAFHTTRRKVVDARLIDVPDSAVRLALWGEVAPDGRTVPHYAVSLDGATMSAAQPTSYVLKLRHGEFDPAVQAPAVRTSLAAGDGTGLYIVQFVTQPLEAYRAAIAALGGTVYGFLANHAHIVQMDAGVKEQVADLPYVRWVGPCHPAYRLEDELRDNLDRADELFPLQRYNVLLFEPVADRKPELAQRLKAIGAIVDSADAGKLLMVATLTPAQLLEVVSWDEVAFVDRWTPMEPDMNNARATGGADYIEGVAGYTGAGVRAEVFDGGFNLSHVDFASRPLIPHGTVNSDSHGASTSGICFGDGTGDPTARGMLPDGQGIVADYDDVGLHGVNRYNHTAELLEDPYFAVFQTASVGDGRTTEYTTISAEHDAMLFDLDILHCQSQSNAGTRASRPQAWAKNVVSGGGVRHYNTLDRSDDCWCGGASIGPATDGRIKPDLSHYYDSIRTTTTGSTTAYTSSFGGTSGATPIICGHFGLFFQMWADGIFGNPVDPGGTVFDNRPHMATAKAVMINTASPYPFTGQSDDLTRVHQGWGHPDLRYLFDMRDNISVIDETDLLTNLQTLEYYATVVAGEPALRATLVYTDPAGAPLSTQNRINDLTLKVLSPTGTTYWGNNGLLDGNWSVPGGSPNTVDTVENVFVQNPEAGIWTVDVIASEINEDSHVETPEVDADFALVVTGSLLTRCLSAGVIQLDEDGYPCTSDAAIRVLDCDLNTDDGVVETVTVSIASATEPGGEPVLLTETGPHTADFRGSIPLDEVDAAGVLQIAHGDTVTATYIDADDGQGGVNVVVTDDAVVDCLPPVISDVWNPEVQPYSATTTFNTDEPATGAVHYGESCGALTSTASEVGFETSHSVLLTGLDENTVYYYIVEAEDAAGNVGVHDNDGACHAFATPDIPDAFTELFTSDNDLDDSTLLLTLTGSTDFYDACADTITALPTDPTGGTPIPLTDNDFAEITLTGGASVLLYGTAYTSIFVGSNGYLTFTAGDTGSAESLEEHFDVPRISALYDDLNPASGGTVSWKQLADRVAVTFENVPQVNTSDANTFQFELFFDGGIRLSWLGISASDGLAGLSQGGGVPYAFSASDLTAYRPCSCFQVMPLEAVVSTGVQGGPFNPACGTYTLSNRCDYPVDWTLGHTETWLDVTPAGGTLSPLGTDTVEACINEEANAFTPALYADTLTYTDTTNGQVRSRVRQLNVTAPCFIDTVF